MTDERMSKAALDAIRERVKAYTLAQKAAAKSIENGGGISVVGNRKASLGAVIETVKLRANAPYDVPALLAEVDALRVELADARSLASEYHAAIKAEMDDNFPEFEMLRAIVNRQRTENDILKRKVEQERNYSAGLLAMQDQLYHAVVDLQLAYQEEEGCLNLERPLEDALKKVFAAHDATEMLSEEEVSEAHMTEVARLQGDLDALRVENNILKRKVELYEQQAETGMSNRERVYFTQREQMVAHRAALQVVIDGLRGKFGTKYTVQKSSRVNKDRRDSYTGPSCQDAKMIPGRTFATLEEAQAAADALSFYNGVGFVVVKVGGAG